MRRLLFYGQSVPNLRCRRYSAASVEPPIVSINAATFYRHYPTCPEQDSIYNPAIFPNLKFSVPSSPCKKEHWAIIGPSNAGKTTFFQILGGQHVCLPPSARSFPYLSSHDVDPRYRDPARAIQYVGFDGEPELGTQGGTRGAYLSARYESQREDTDFTVLDYLQGNTSLNLPEQQNSRHLANKDLEKIIDDLNLGSLVNMPVGNLSNGQTRRAKIAKALSGKPLIVLLDEPFMGLDPTTTRSLSPLLYHLAELNNMRLFLSLRPQDPLPPWITHTVRLGPALRILQIGHSRPENSSSFAANVTKFNSNSRQVVSGRAKSYQPTTPWEDLPTEKTEQQTVTKDAVYPAGSRGRVSTIDSPSDVINVPKTIPSLDPCIKMQSIAIRYNQKIILGDWQESSGRASNGLPNDKIRPKGLNWSIYPGQRWGLFGPNGSGKTTLLSLICSDHPQSYSLPVEIFGRTRLPQLGKPGISIFDIQARIGQSSPEIHAFFPRHLSMRQTLENAWAETFLGIPRLDVNARNLVNTCLRWFEPELNPSFAHSVSHTDRISEERHDESGSTSTHWADQLIFGHATLSTQRVALFLRAIIKKPSLVILDEAFSGMDENVREKCMNFLEWGETKTFTIGEDGHGYTHKSNRATRGFSAEGLSKARHLVNGLDAEQALICVSHVKEECPGVIRHWLCLPEPNSGKSARWGTFPKPLKDDIDNRLWSQVWSA